MAIKHLIGINGATLAVYCVDEYFQYEIVFWDSSLCQPQEMYETAEEALNIGLEMVKVVIGYQ